MSGPNPLSAVPPWCRERQGWPLAATGAVLVASGLAHVVAWAVLGGPWEGPVTWRKPILFGISGGLTAVSMGWVWSKLPARRWDMQLAWCTAIALFVEVGLIDVQRWRGVASHFNRATLLDSVLYDVMGALILFVTLVSVDLMVRSFWQPMPVAADMRLAIQAGLVFLVVSCVLGIWVSVHGELQLDRGLEPTRFGAAGVPKFPHGAVIHAIQWLPILAWAARRAGVAVSRRWKLVAVATLGTALVLAYATLQTLAGRGRFDAPPPLAAILAIGTVCLAVPAVVTAAAWLTSRRRSPPPAAA